jgi:hypothetical protein
MKSNCVMFGHLAPSSMNLPSCQHKKSIYSQKDILRIKSAKSCFFRFSMARIQLKFKKLCQISMHGSSR